MTHRPLDFQDVLRLVELIKSSANFSEIRLRTGDVELELRRGGALTPMAPAPQAAAVPQTTAAVSQAATGPAPAAPVATGPRAPLAPVSRDGLHVVTAPMVGTVYRAPEPGARPFVEVGQRVSPDDPVCIVEVMKLMNSIPAGVHGVVTEVLVADAEAVAHGQALVVIETR